VTGRPPSNILRGMPQRVVWTVLVAFGLASVPRLARAQADDDWSVTRSPRRRTPRTGTAHPGAGHPRTARPGRARPDGPPATVVPPTGDAQRDRRDRMIAVLMQSVLRNAQDDGGPLPVLMRLVRERDGSVDRLIADLATRARAATSDAGPHVVLGSVYRETGRFEDALQEFRTAERIAPTSPGPARAIGSLLRRLEQPAAARAALERALAHTTNRAQRSDALRQLMELSLDANDVAAARRHHHELVVADSASMTVRRELADALLTRHFYDDAAREFERLAVLLAGDHRVLPAVLRDLGRAFVGARRYDEGLRTYRRALAIAASDAGIRREIYDGITEIHAARTTLPAWIRELEHAVGGDTYDRAMLLARLHEQAGSAPGAIAAYRRAIAARPADVDAHVRLAQLFHQQGQRADEVATYRRLVALSPREPRFVTELADVLVSQGAREEAVRLLHDASRRAGNDANMHERLGEVFARLGMQQDALREIEVVARVDPTSPSGLVALGRQLMEMGQRDRALATWRRLLDGARDRARGAAALADVYADNAMLAEAVDTFREAIRLRPAEVGFHRGLAGVLERARQFNLAIEEWRRVIDLTPNDRDARRHAREAIVRLWGLDGRLASQIPLLEQEFARTPPDVEAGRDLAEAYIRSRRLDDAERVLRRVATLAPGDSSVHLSLERVLTQRGDLAGAIVAMQHLVDADPRRARDTYQRMAQTALALHRDEQALEFATRAVQLNDQDATAHLRLAELYRARNDMGHAIASLRRALELNDRLFPSYFQLADLYLGSRDEPREAIALYRRVIQLAPDDDDVSRAGRQLVQLAPAAGMGDDVERDLSTASAAMPARTVFRRLLVSYFDAVARPLIQRAVHGNPQESANARTELRRLGVRGLAPMLGALGDADPAQQRVALEVLGYLGNPNASSALLAVAEGNGDGDLRRRAVVAAGSLGDARMLPRLTALQRRMEDVDPSLATIATWAIAQIHTPAATRALVGSLARDRGTAVRTAAALGLTGTTDARARVALREILLPARAMDHGLEVRAAATFALAGALDPQTLATVRATLADGQSSTLLRAACAAALGRSGDVSVAADLARAMFDTEIALRRAGAGALAALASPRPTLHGRTLDDPSLAATPAGLLARWIDAEPPADSARRALVAFRTSIAQAANDALLSDDRAMVVLSALARPDRLGPLVEPIVAGEAPDVVAALQSIVDSISPRVAALALQGSARTRRGAVEILARSRDDGAPRALARAASDPDEVVAVAALGALGARRPSPDVTEAIAARLAPDVPWVVRRAAVMALGGRSDEASQNALIRAAIGDAFAYVRLGAVRALGAHPDAPAVRDALVRVGRDDEDRSVRDAARDALR